MGPCGCNVNGTASLPSKQVVRVRIPLTAPSRDYNLSPLPASDQHAAHSGVLMRARTRMPA